MEAQLATTPPGQEMPADGDMTYPPAEGTAEATRTWDPVGHEHDPYEAGEDPATESIEDADRDPYGAQEGFESETAASDALPEVRVTGWEATSQEDVTEDRELPEDGAGFGGSGYQEAEHRDGSEETSGLEASGYQESVDPYASQEDSGDFASEADSGIEAGSSYQGESTGYASEADSGSEEGSRAASTDYASDDNSGPEEGSEYREASTDYASADETVRAGSEYGEASADQSVSEDLPLSEDRSMSDAQESSADDGPRDDVEERTVETVHPSELESEEGFVQAPAAAALSQEQGVDQRSGFGSPRPGGVEDETNLPPAPFGSTDPHVRARRLARALVSDIVVYHPDRRESSLRDGTLRQEFRDEIRKSWDEYVAHVGDGIARDTSYFRDALNDLLAGGARLF